MEIAIDMRQRYVGHCNVGTDIKQASFLGAKGDFVASGSDDGRWFIWQKRTGRLMKVLTGDEIVVNCVQCHPFDCAVATSGIDNTIKIWTPCAQIPSIVSGGVAGPETADMFNVMAENQRKMRNQREISLPFELLQRFRMHDVGEGTVHPFECTQS
jgi:WD and tetratricopeptide repeat-containing protein 1